MMNRAYSLLNVKSIDEQQKEVVIRGIASTPTPDRMDDIVEPLGARFKLPMPLLWQHRHDEPVGLVTFAAPNQDGIPFEARLPVIQEAGTLKDRVDEAIQSVRHQLVAAVSIGFKAVAGQLEVLKTGGIRYKQWDWLELSLVTIPANQEATIGFVKSLDHAIRHAASGTTGRPVVSLFTPVHPGASGNSFSLKGNVMNVTQQIASFEAKRAAEVSRMEEIMAKSAEEGRTLLDAESQEYDGLQLEVKAIDSHLVRLREHEKALIAKATPITADSGADPDAATKARAGQPLISVKANIEPGVKMARYAMALFQAEGDTTKALNIIKSNHRWMDQTPELASVMKAAVAAGDTTTSGWASELVYATNLANEFIDYLRPKTVIGRIQNFRRVPFNIRVASQSSTSSAYWVGQGAPIKMSKPGLSSTSLGIAKICGLVAIDEELARSSSPSAELLVRDDLAKTIATYTDQQFLDPNVSAVSNVNPASMTNGLTAVTPTGTSYTHLRTDLMTMLKSWAQNDVDTNQGIWIMPPKVAMNIGAMVNTLGTQAFPGIDINGGTLLGLPVIVSNNADISGSPDSGNMIILLQPNDVFLADDGQVTIDVSREASIQMLDNPTNTSTSGTTATTMVSMYQTHSLAIRATRFINWAKRRSTCCVFMQDAAYAA